MQLNSQVPLVTVCCITYNHGGFIRECIEGFLIQKTNFPIEILIFDDASSDDNQRIISEYSNKYVYLKSYFQKDNLWSQNKFGLLEVLFPLAKGKYIALCEGDDFWTDPYKLQKQIDFLESNQDFVICYHSVEVRFPNGKKEIDFGVNGIIEKSESSVYDLAVLGNYIHTPSVVFRNLVKEYPITLKKYFLGDFFLWMVLAQYGKIKKLPDVMAVYRIGVGFHSSQSEKARQTAFLKTLLLLTEIIEDKTIIEILKNRMAAIKSASLPYPVRVLDDYRDLVKAEYLKNYISLGQLIKAVWLKILMRF